MPGWWFGGEDGDDERSRAAENSLELIDLLHKLVDVQIDAGQFPFPVEPDLVRSMHRIAMNGLLDEPGVYRDAPAPIENSKHVPPSHFDVPELVGEMCSVLNAGGDPIRLASYALWRLNWIHPFPDGNGRTARALTHLTLLLHIGIRRLPGRRALPDRIADEPRKYWRCLEEADGAYKRRRLINVSHLQGFIERHLRAMLKEGMG